MVNTGPYAPLPLPSCGGPEVTKNRRCRPCKIGPVTALCHFQLHPSDAYQAYSASPEAQRVGSTRSDAAGCGHDPAPALISASGPDDGRHSPLL